MRPTQEFNVGCAGPERASFAPNVLITFDDGTVGMIDGNPGVQRNDSRPPVGSTSTLPHHVSDRAGDNLRKVISQIIDLACDAVEFPIGVIEPRMHVALNVLKLAEMKPNCPVA